jgi:glyoxylase-like metal-dependent hydrolase (beta-lactamase superfamily II)
MTRPPLTLARRDLLRLAALAPALALPSPLRALPAPVSPQAPGWFRFMLGEIEVTVVSDGNLATPTSLLGVNADPEEVRAFLAANFLDAQTIYAHTNHVLLRSGDRLTLVDVGSGPNFQPTSGRLVANMEAADIAPEDVTDVLLTHAHPDHVWGAMDDFGDEPRFPEAAHRIGATEFDWWMQEGLTDRVEEGMLPFVVGAQNALGALEPRLETVADGAQPVPGATMIDTPGHTFGHMSVLVESGDARMLVIGDALNHGHISFARPDWHPGLDMDRPLAVETRRRLLDMAAEERLVVVGYHFPFPGVGHVVRDGDAYRFLPALWRWNQ